MGSASGRRNWRKPRLDEAEAVEATERPRTRTRGHGRGGLSGRARWSARRGKAAGFLGTAA
jgi:hypothetical protein